MRMAHKSLIYREKRESGVEETNWDGKCGMVETKINKWRQIAHTHIHLYFNGGGKCGIDFSQIHSH